MRVLLYRYVTKLMVIDGSLSNISYQTEEGGRNELKRPLRINSIKYISPDKDIIHLRASLVTLLRSFHPLPIRMPGETRQEQEFLPHGHVFP